MKKCGNVLLSVVTLLSYHKAAIVLLALRSHSSSSI